MDLYEEEFYKKRHETTVYAARVILSLLLDVAPRISSAVDIGCGVGTWLSVLREMGIKYVRGVDGAWVAERWLVVPRNCFIRADFRSDFELDEKFDLAISLEVAEHLPQDRAEWFVSKLANLSDIVLFSAAIPYQGGVGHINEQWQSYWAELFAARDYIIYDFIRPRIWDDRKIPFWYRQNILVFVKRGKSLYTGDNTAHNCSMPLNVVHPEALLTAKQPVALGVKTSFKLLVSEIRAFLTKSKKFS